MVVQLETNCMHTTLRIIPHGSIRIATGSASSTPGNGLNILVGDTLYLNAYTVANGRELWAYQPSPSTSKPTQEAQSSLGHQWKSTQWPLVRHQQRNNLRSSNRIVDTDIVHGWANNSGGSTVGYLNITVNDLLPTLSYSPNDLVSDERSPEHDLPLNATLTGVRRNNIMGNQWLITSRSELRLQQRYDLGHTNRTADIIRDLHHLGQQLRWILVSNGQHHHLGRDCKHQLQPSAVTIVRGYDMANISVTKTGGIVVSWEISPSLPSGLSFDNGTIYGLPLVNMSSTIYTVYANNSGGSASRV